MGVTKGTKRNSNDGASVVESINKSAEVSMHWYNGFSPKEQNAKNWALRKAIKAGTVSRPSGPCALCGDPNVPVEYHSEDYSKPYCWHPPAAYELCRHCHRLKLHKRFTNPGMWNAFKAHVRRGGYASDLTSTPAVRREFETYRSVPRGERMELRPLRRYHGVVREEWWEQLATIRPGENK